LAAAWRRSTFIDINEPGELLQWLCHDDSTLNMVLELLLLSLLLEEDSWAFSVATARL